MRILALALALAAPLGAHAEPAPAKSIPWYEAHPDVLAATMKACHDNSQYANTPTCVNVEAAATGLRARGAPSLDAMFRDPRYWELNPIARDGYLVQCQLGTAMTTRYCAIAARAAGGR